MGSVFTALCQKFFRDFDKDKSGALELREVRVLVWTLCENMGIDPPSSSYVEAEFAKADVSHTVSLLQAEFVVFFEVLLQGVLLTFREKERAAQEMAEEIEVNVVTMVGAEVGAFNVVRGSKISGLIEQVEAVHGKPESARRGFSLLHGVDELRPKSTFLKARIPDTAMLTLIEKDLWPSLAENEIEFEVESPCQYAPKDPTRSPPIEVDTFPFRILVFPAGASGSTGTHVSAYVEVVPAVDDTRLEYPSIYFKIKLCNWLDFSRSIERSDTHTFTASGATRDRGWHDFVPLDDLVESKGWVGPDGTLCVRAACSWRKKGTSSSDSDTD